MKELSIEEKAARYDEAFETARKINSGEGVAAPPDWTTCEVIFPELRESEDERIKKEIIKYFQKYQALSLGDYNVQNILDWIEKQGEHANFINKIQIGDKVTRNQDGILVNLSQLKRVAKKDEKQDETFTKKDVDDAYLKGICDAKHELEKQNNMGISEATKQKLEDNLNKALEKETAESWNEFLDEQCGQKQDVNMQIEPSEYINDMGGNGCYLKNTAQKSADKIEPIFNVGDKIQYLKGCGTIMTIEKIENGEYIFTNNLGHTTIESGNKWYLVNPVEQKPAWSEEDERMKNQLVDFMLSGIDISKAPYGCVAWLKSLMPQNTWKPSDEQMVALDDFIYAKYPNIEKYGAAVKSLYQDLKKLNKNK